MQLCGFLLQVGTGGSGTGGSGTGGANGDGAGGDGAGTGSTSTSMNCRMSLSGTHRVFADSIT